MSKKWLGPAALMGVFAGLLWAERRRPLRTDEPEPGARRVVRNVAVGAITAAAIRVAEQPLIGPLSRRVADQRLGLAQRLPWPPAARRAAALLLMDYSLYWWHVLLHRIPWLWRLHAVHHTDLELDVSTAIRFHFGEFLASVPWRAVQVRLIGVDPVALRLWQRLTLAEVMFHHSNLRLPLHLERLLSRLVVTPRLHGIHHSLVRAETDSNFSSGLAIWDHVHGTARRNVPQALIIIGVPAYRDPRALRLAPLLIQPLAAPRRYWHLPNGGTPRRIVALPPAGTLSA